MTNQSLKIVPQTTLGKWAVGLIVLMPILFMLGASLSGSLYLSVPSGDTILEDIVARPALALSMLVGMLSGILAFATGIFAIIRQKENAILVYVAIIFGAILILFLFGEVLSPH